MQDHDDFGNHKWTNYSWKKWLTGCMQKVAKKFKSTFITVINQRSAVAVWIDRPRSISYLDFWHVLYSRGRSISERGLLSSPIFVVWVKGQIASRLASCKQRHTVGGWSILEGVLFARQGYIFWNVLWMNSLVKKVKKSSLSWTILFSKTCVATSQFLSI